MFKLDLFRKDRGTRDQIANIRWIIKKAREFQKNIHFCFIDYAKAFDCGSQPTVEDSSRGGNTRPLDLPPEKSLCRSSREQLEIDMEQQTGSKSGKEDIKAVLSPCLFNFYAEYIIETLGWMKHKLESRLPRKISITSDMQITPPLWQKAKEN